MCDCDEFESTINRGDEVMIAKKPVNFWYNIGVEDLWYLLVYLKKYSIVRNVWTSKDGRYIQVRAVQYSVERIAFGAGAAGVLVGMVVTLIFVFFLFGVH